MAGILITTISGAAVGQLHCFRNVHKSRTFELTPLYITLFFFIREFMAEDNQENLK